jgi:glyoxylase-like metal-dependent hydrolase (beta-lactamase superfamily II)
VEAGLLTKLDDQVSIIDTMALGKLGVVAAYLVSGKERALIDMGYRSSAQSVIHDLEQDGLGADDIDYLLPTHVHLDHSGGCGTLAEKYVDASVRVHPKGMPHLADPSKVWVGAGELFGPLLMEQFGKPQPIARSRLREVSDNEQISLGSGLTLRTLWTPGHASHHLSYELEGAGSVATGDAVGIIYPNVPILVPTTPPTSFDLSLAIGSLERIRDTRPARILAPHYGVMADATKLIADNIQALKDWEVKIGSMLKDGATPEQITRTLTDETARRAGQSLGIMPDYLSVSIKVSVLGFIRYLRTVAKVHDGH